MEKPLVETFRLRVTIGSPPLNVRDVLNITGAASKDCEEDV
jgi:hypothetical protein